MSMLSSSLVINFGATNRPVEDGMIEILDGPTGFMCIKRSVFKKFEDEFPSYGAKTTTRIAISTTTTPVSTA